ncbi:class I SAM-dependent methyltransferase [Streptomyces sp. NPDC048172]|uniref:class I SAM-dependent methyltransferase n=1 Tax=Streptomyces sp. NPDC048172 TaxID=3365505 RepID=UPI003724B135
MIDTDLPFAPALRPRPGALFLRCADGRLLPLEADRWHAAPDAADATVLRRCRGAVLDVGCGPGRMVSGLAALGLRALGIDVSGAAVHGTVGRGGSALRRSVFDPLPGEGRWGTLLLMDGNVGIGGDPPALLRRLTELAAPDGVLLVETEAETGVAGTDERLTVRVHDGRSAHGPAFPWARVGPRALRRYAAREGWRVTAQWHADGRAFTELRRALGPSVHLG